MNKAKLIEAVQNALGSNATKCSAEDAVSAVLDSIAKGIKKDKKVQIIGFGSFVVKNLRPRVVRNPRTGEARKINAPKSVRFTASSALKKSL